MQPDRKNLILPVLLIVVGAGWLLTTLGYAPDIDWIWTLGLAVVGLLTFVVASFDKVSFVAGSFFLVTSGLSVLRQTGRLELNVELPILVMLAGVLMLIARHPAIPSPKWIVDISEPEQRPR